MRHFSSLAALLLVCLLPSLAHAQTFTAPVDIEYQLPTANDDGSPLTGQFALTKLQIFLSATPIADDSTMAPTAEFTTGLGEPIASSFSIANGGTIYIRMRACHQFACSVFSNQTTKVATVPKPGAPNITTVTIRIVP